MKSDDEDIVALIVTIKASLHTDNTRVSRILGKRKAGMGTSMGTRKIRCKP